MKPENNIENTAGSDCPAATCSAWVRTAERLPGKIGEQVDVLMWSPEWATWLKGMVTRWEDECEWAIYNQQDDRYHEWEHVPEFWMSPILPNAGRVASADENQSNQTKQNDT
jgi:hypothetical protein